jgi:hypothetical protein
LNDFAEHAWLEHEGRIIMGAFQPDRHYRHFKVIDFEELGRAVHRPPAVRKTDSRSMWVNELRQRRGYNRATVAVANKSARVIWAVLMSGEPYRSAA